MLYRTLADLVLAFHAVFITFVMFGGLLALWRPRLAWLHLPALAWGALVIGMGWLCPLTPLETRCAPAPASRVMPAASSSTI